MAVERSTFSGFGNWGGYPVYHCRYVDEYKELCVWMRQHDVSFRLLSTNLYGYKFQVKSKHDWFALRWL